MLLLPVLLGWVVFRWASELNGAWAGALASAFLLFDVNVSAHSGLVMPDIALTTFLALTGYAMWKAEAGGMAWRAAAGAFFGLACLSKTPALLAAPAFAAAALLSPRPGRNRWRSAAADMGILFAMALVVVAVGYRVTGFPWWLRDVADRFLQTTPGQGVVFYGRSGIQRGADPLGYLAKIFFKSTPPFLLAAAWCLYAARRAPLRLRVMGLGVTALFFVATVFSASQSAVRYLLPLFPFLLMLGVFVRGAVERSLGAALLAAQLAVLVGAHPQTMAYTNFFYRDRGVPIFSGSEFDFGQDLPAVSAFLRRDHNASAVLCYFGWADPRAYGIDAQLLPGYPVLMSEENPHVNPVAPSKEWLIISVSSLQGHRDRDIFEPLVSRGPDARIDKTFWAWDITRDAAVHARLAVWYGRYGWDGLAAHDRARAGGLGRGGGGCGFSCSGRCGPRGPRPRRWRGCGHWAPCSPKLMRNNWA
jgi:hypothetical protein